MAKRHALNDDPEYRDPALEWPDPTPVDVPLKYQGKAPPSLQEEIRRLMLLAEHERRQQDAETFEEADDFDVDEDPDLFDSQYELNEMQEEAPVDRESPAASQPATAPAGSPASATAPAAAGVVAAK